MCVFFCRALDAAQSTTTPSHEFLQAIDTDDNLADFFTKSLTPIHFYRFKHLIMNTDDELCNTWRKAGQALADKLLSQKLRAAESSGSLADDDDCN